MDGFRNIRNFLSRSAAVAPELNNPGYRIEGRRAELQRGLNNSPAAIDDAISRESTTTVERLRPSSPSNTLPTVSRDSAADEETAGLGGILTNTHTFSSDGVGAGGGRVYTNTMIPTNQRSPRSMTEYEHQQIRIRHLMSLGFTLDEAMADVYG